MKNNFLDSITLGVICFGSIVGAGFASGKEIWVYFARFGWIAYPMIIAVGIIFGNLVNMFLNWGNNHKIISISQMNDTLFKQQTKTWELLYVLCNFILLTAMFAGFDSIGKLIFPNLNYRFFGLIFVFISLGIAMLNFKKMVKINLVLVPLLLILIILGLFFSLNNTLVLLPQSNTTLAPIYALLYLSSNIYIISFILTKLGNTFAPSTHKAASIISAILLITFASIITIILQLNPTVTTSTLPLVEILLNNSISIRPITMIVVLLSILTTAVTLIYTINNEFVNFLNSKIISCTLICLVSFLLAKFGFSFIVNYFYILIGVIGFFLCLKLIKNSH